MVPGILHGAVTFAVFVADVSLVYILQTGDWAGVFMPAGHCFSTYITTTAWH